MRSIVGFIAFFAFLASSMAIALGIVRLGASIFATPNPNLWEFVYVSDSPNAHRYHYSNNCKALSKTSYNIELLTIEEAEDYDYEPCKLCLEASVSHQWDEAAGILFFPVSCLVYWLINATHKFCKKYKFRNPIVRR